MALKYLAVSSGKKRNMNCCCSLRLFLLPKRQNGSRQKNNRDAQFLSRSGKSQTRGVLHTELLPLFSFFSFYLLFFLLLPSVLPASFSFSFFSLLFLFPSLSLSLPPLSFSLAEIKRRWMLHPGNSTGKGQDVKKRWYRWAESWGAEDTGHGRHSVRCPLPGSVFTEEQSDNVGMQHSGDPQTAPEMGSLLSVHLPSSHHLKNYGSREGTETGNNLFSQFLNFYQCKSKLDFFLM